MFVHFRVEVTGVGGRLEHEQAQGAQGGDGFAEDGWLA
jgi:hypothetical protein